MTATPPLSAARSVSERDAACIAGWLGLLMILALSSFSLIIFALGFFTAPNGASAISPANLVVSAILLLFALIGWFGMFVVQPNQAEVLVLFGRYLGSIKNDGWYWTNPFASKRKISLRVHNFNSAQLKVNDADGNPIEIAAVIVWRVVETAKATFDVENYTEFVEIQSETAIRHLASQYPYEDGQHPGETSLRGSADEVGKALRAELQSRLEVAGIDVLEARLSHLAYSPEIAGAMLQRQQASAIIAARQRIVEGAVTMVEMALEMIAEKNVVTLTPSQKAEMVSNLLVVLTSERGTQPVISTTAKR